jgi:hypothetical protein
MRNIQINGGRHWSGCERGNFQSTRRPGKPSKTPRRSWRPPKEQAGVSVNGRLTLVDLAGADYDHRASQSVEHQGEHCRQQESAVTKGMPSGHFREQTTTVSGI